MKHDIGSFDFCADFLASVTHCRLHSKMGDAEILFLCSLSEQIELSLALPHMIALT